MRALSRRILLCALVALLVSAGVALAQLGVVMKDGTVVKCVKYELKGNVYVLTMPGGKLTSVKADSVDAQATEGYAEKLKAQAEAEAQMKESKPTEAAGQPAAATGKGDAAVSLTNEDLKKYEGDRSSMGNESTVTADTPPMPDRKDYEAALKRGAEEKPEAPAVPKGEAGGEKPEPAKEKTGEN